MQMRISGNSVSSASDKRRKKEEEEQHGIFFDDDYDYLQHVKPRTNMSLEPLPENVTVIEAKNLLPLDHLEVILEKIRLCTCRPSVGLVSSPYKG